MNDREIEALERRIAERERIKKMAQDLAESEKERKAWSNEQEKKAPSITKAYGGGSSAKVRSTGDFSREQNRYNGRYAE